MGNYYYRDSKCDEDSGYVRAEILRYTINYVKNSGEFGNKPILDFLLCSLRRKQVEGILGQFADVIAKDAEDETSSFDYLYRKTLDYIADRSDTSDSSTVLDEILVLCEKELIETSASIGPEDDLFVSRLKELKDIFKLSDEDLEVFKLLYFLRNKKNFGRMCSNAAIGVSGLKDAAATVMIISFFTNLSEMSVRKVLGKESPLRRYGILEDDFDIVSQISEFLSGLSSETLTNKFFRRYTGQALELDVHVNVAQHVDMLEGIIRNCGAGERVNILLYGHPGTGKTEFCRSLGRHLQRDIYEVNTFEKGEWRSSGTKFRFAALRACQNTVDVKSAIIMIDEADEMLNGNSTASAFIMTSPRNTEKNLVNDCIDNNPGVYFWITNHYASMDSSTRRRFDYSIEFRKFTALQRNKIWHSCIDKHGLGEHFSSGEIAVLAKKYEINAGGMDVALKNYKRVTKDMGNEAAQKGKSDIIQKILAPHIKLMGGERRMSDNTLPVSSYSLEGLNVKGEFPLGRSLDILKSFSEQASDAGSGDDGVRNMNVLLYGPPGTGKTEFAKFAAMEIGRPLLCKRGSDLLNMWVGGTERNIREAFAEAETEGAILFIDEADGLFADRGFATKSWEVTQVNELLSGMEEFKGILICATNFKKNLDTASIRRFNLKIEFDYLDSNGKDVFFKRVLGELSGKELEASDVATLERIDNLTPGDFKVIRQKYSFMPKEKLTNSVLISSLQLEAASKNGVNTSRIGF
jgi:transitional endoplasmic reticulum ATPase